ncbi:MAG: protein kinase [Candidatus Latescibacterota bacterium]|nr:MAG: protein kinase [Candidatus Latescibacterota bacterium]
MSGETDRLACSDVLAGCQAFSRLPLSVRDLLSAFMVRQSFQTGEVLMRQGEQGTNLMVIGRGSAQVTLRLPDGSERPLEIVSRGDIVGEMALLTRDPRTADVVALEAGEAFVLSADVFEVLTSRHPDISVVLTDLLTERFGRQQIDALGQKVLHGYRVEECIGRGGMGTVYRAVHEESGERVALKMMHHRLVYDPDALARFQREADIAESLAHKNIVRVYGRFSDYKTYFMVMEFCDGPTLGRVIREWGGLQEDAVRAVIGQLAQALTYLHERDLAHRDLKPSNVLLTHAGRVKLADFGLARPVYARKLTLRGVAVGTPAYMAPEQIAGRNVDSSVDIYALGCLAYELLTGAPMFDEEELTALIYKKMKWELPPRAEILEDLSEELYDVLRMSLSSRPQERRIRLAEIAGWAQPLDTDLGGPGIEGSEGSTQSLQPPDHWPDGVT